MDRNDQIASRANATRRTIKFLKDPTPNIVLGDSRIAYVSENKLNELMNGQVSNLALPGASLKTVIDLFWFADSTTELENVIIQINFNRYNEVIDYDLLTSIRPLINSPNNYFFNRLFIKDAVAVLLNSLRKNYKTRFSHSNDSLWSYQAYWIINSFRDYGYEYPAKFNAELNKISRHCSNNDIKLTFLIAPNFHQVFQLYEEFDYCEEYYKFKSDLKSLGETIDLDSGLTITYNRDLYSDFFHFTPELSDTLVSLIYKHYPNYTTLNN